MIRKELNGLSYLLKDGVGEPHIFLHGISSDSECFRALMAALPYPCLAWDMPGYGHSKPLQRAMMVDYLSEISAIADKEGYKQFTLTGSSLGGLLAGYYAATYPNRLSALVLISPASGYGLPESVAWPASVSARLAMLRSEGAKSYAAKRASNLIYQPEKQPYVLASVQRAMGALRVEGLEPASTLLAESDLTAKAQHITTPTLIICGENDTITPIDKVATLVPCFTKTSCSLARVDEAGHAIYQEKVEAVKSLLLNFQRRRE